MNSALEQTILERLHDLDDTRLTEVLDFVDLLRQQSTTATYADEVAALRGKYRNIMMPSEDFMRRKEEKHLEEEKWQW